MPSKTLATIAGDGAAGAFEYDGGPAVLVLRGTWGGATVKIQVSDNGTNYVDWRDDSGFTADGAVSLDPLPRCYLQAVASSSSSSTSITFAIIDDTAGVYA
jgi:hypothetical protein